MVFGNNELLAQFYSSLGDAYHSQKNHIMSDESYDKSLELSPLNTYVLNNYSYYLSLRKENLDKALEMMELCTALNQEWHLTKTPMHGCFIKVLR